MKVHLSIFFVCIILIIGCRRLEDKPSWDVDVYTPLLKTDLDIYDILIDSLMEEQSDNSIDLIYKNKLFYYTIDSFLQIPDKVIEKVIRIDNLVIDDKTIEYPMTLGQIARAEGGLIGTLILTSHGNSMQIPPLNGLSTDPFDVDATGFFQQATIDTGKIDVTIYNGLPVDADSIMYYFKNKNLGNLILRDTFIHIPAGITQTHTFTLTNIVLEGLLKAELENFNTPGSGTASVPIDTNNAIVLTIKVYDLDLIDATAYFPSQNLINDTLPSVLEGLDALLTESTVKAGHLSVEMISTVPDSLYFDYTLPDVSKNGASFVGQNVLPPAPVGSNISHTETYPIDGYHFDLRGPEMDTFNTFLYTMVASLNESGKLIYISKTDSFRLYFGFLDILPSYVKGYFGRDTLNIPPTSIELDIFNYFNSGSISFDDISIELEITNSIGAEGKIKINDIVATNTSSGNSNSLTCASLIGTNININRATETPFTNTVVSNILDKSNSNILDLINLMPDQISFSGEVEINPNGNTLNYQDFAYETSAIEGNLNMQLPLSFIANDLSLSQEADFNLYKIKNNERIKDGTFTMNVDNGFPLSASISIVFLEDQIVLDSLTSSSIIEAADLNAQGKVTQSKNSRVKYTISESMMSTILNANKARINTSFNSAPDNQYVKIYSDYKMGFQLIGDFTYQIKNKDD